MPTIWTLCLDCMNLQTGQIVHWPLVGGWLENADLLSLMHYAWSAWRVFSISPDVIMNDADFDLQNAFLEGKPMLPKPLTDYEAWAAENE